MAGYREPEYLEIEYLFRDDDRDIYFVRFADGRIVFQDQSTDTHISIVPESDCHISINGKTLNLEAKS